MGLTCLFVMKFYSTALISFGKVSLSYSQDSALSCTHDQTVDLHQSPVCDLI